MVVLHIAAIENNPFNGVCVAVPQHVLAQKQYVQVGLINIKKIEIEALLGEKEIQMDYIEPFDVKKLPKPFDQPDIVIFHECYRVDFLSIAKNLKKNGIPYIVMPHGELRREAQQKKHLKKIAANILLFDRFINNAISVQCLSSDELEATHFGRRKFVGTNGVFMPIANKSEFSKNGVKFLYIGRYEWKVKGFDLLFKAIQMEAPFLRENNCTFELYGPDILGRLEVVTQMVRDNHIEDIVILNHEISGCDKEKKLLEADVFIQTSRHEGMPMGILEALSYGVPCMVSEGTTLAHKISSAKAGWNAGNTVESISASLREAVLDRQKWNELGRNGKLLVQNEFSWQNVAQQITKQYFELVSEEK